MKLKALLLIIPLLLLFHYPPAFSEAAKNPKYSVVFKNKVFFDISKSNLEPAAVKVLENFSSLIKKFPENQIVIEGYADSSGVEKANRRLSFQRAESVYNFLLKQGIEKDRLHFTGFGTLNAAGDNATDRGRKNNRRAEIIVLKFDYEN
ncbi:MAG: OmpA family protein [Endomicrobium sp.]|jgi:outer membrane protein OmpA-like peptidoglycan-associated protein|nr:OmpA family protein [Endomicrobium sp.]